MNNQEIILERDRVECLVENLKLVLEVKSHYQFKLRFDEKTLTIIPHASPVEIVLKK